ncbi:MAG TPA: sugar ABC transporter ATP-binding protein [Candidatus Pelethocola excrementipullorum]|nr:sugar ABC transporter ATP-binding protein [Candidatus Pelethocola excrementipullorum]
MKQNAQVVILKKLINRVLINKKKSSLIMEEMKKEYAIKSANVNNSIMTLSGGNQQKVIIARWIATNPAILMCDEPTRGIDVGAKEEVYAIIREIAKKGIGIIMVSSELPELLSLCDRIIVMHEGKKTGELLQCDATEEGIMKLAADVG